MAQPSELADNTLLPTGGFVPGSDGTITTNVLHAETIPVEIWTMILSFTPSFMHIILALVCKEWRDILLRLREKRGEKTWNTTYSIFFQSPQMLECGKNIFPSWRTHPALDQYILCYGSDGMCDTLITTKMWYITTLSVSKFYDLIHWGRLHVLMQIEMKYPGYVADMFRRDHWVECAHPHTRFAFDAYIENINISCDNRWKMLLWSIRYNYIRLPVFEWVFDHIKDTCPSVLLLIIIVRSNNVEFLRWLVTNRTRHFASITQERILSYIMQNNNIQLAKCLIECGYTAEHFTRRILLLAVNLDTLNVLVFFAREHMLPNHFFEAIIYSQRPDEEKMNIVMRMNIDGGVQFNDRLCVYAAINGFYTFVQLLNENHYPIPATICAYICESTMRRNDEMIAMLTYLTSQGFHLTQDVYIKLVDYQHHINRVDILNWCWTQNIPVPANLAQEAMYGPRISELHWALLKGCHSTQDMLYAAARKNHLVLLQYLHAHGHPLDGQVLGIALRRTHRQYVQEDGVEETNANMIAWLRENNCPELDGYVTEDEDDYPEEYRLNDMNGNTETEEEADGNV